ncbi:MAG: hypothetical protein QOF48_1627 [Verrucomicrobiota bacterium]|jgi:hypothetical protein
MKASIVVPGEQIQARVDAGFPSWLFAGVVIALTLFFVPSTRAVDPPPSGRAFDTLTVRGTAYTKVTIVDISKRHVSFRSAQGFATVLLEDLEPDALSQLGRGALNLGVSERAGNASSSPRSSGATPIKARETATAEAEGGPDDKAQCESTHDEPFHWTIRNIAGTGLLGLGFLTIAAGHVWLVGAAFRTSPGWGIAVLIGTFVAGIITMMFCRTHWHAARRPVFLKLAGLVVVVGGFFLFHS